MMRARPNRPDGKTLKSHVHSESQLDRRKRPLARATKFVLVGGLLAVMLLWWNWTSFVIEGSFPKADNRVSPSLRTPNAKAIIKWMLNSTLESFDAASFLVLVRRAAELVPRDSRLGDKAAMGMRSETLDWELAKSKVSFSTDTRMLNNGGCSFIGPEYVGSSKSQARFEEDLVNKFAGNSPSIGPHLKETRGAKLLSLDEHDICSWHPTVFLPSVPGFSQALAFSELSAQKQATRQDLSSPSAYVFHDVCVTWNIDSSKQAQRGVVMVDPSNNKKSRCMPCPNPQTTYSWGTNPCGMMWFHQINVKSLSEYQSCYDLFKRDMKAAGQRQIPGDRKKFGPENRARAAIYYEEPTLLLQYTRNNPGHQLWDSLSSIIPILRSQDVHGVRYYKHVFSQQTPDCPRNVWFCELLRMAGGFDTKDLLPAFPGVLPCFKQLIVPIQGWNHQNAFSSKAHLGWLRDTLVSSFKLDGDRSVDTPQMVHDILAKRTGSRKYSLLLYAHLTEGEAGRRRNWDDAKKTIADLESNYPMLNIDIIADFGALAVRDQAAKFNQADLIVMAHGGQFGNIFFAKKGALVVELCCGGYSHAAIGQGVASALSIQHVVQQPCSCDKASTDSNFRYTADHFVALLEHMVGKLDEEGLTHKVKHVC